MNTLKPIIPTQRIRSNDRYAEHEWHKQLNEKRAKKERAEQLIAELRAKGHVINILA